MARVLGSASGQCSINWTACGFIQVYSKSTAELCQLQGNSVVSGSVARTVNVTDNYLSIICKREHTFYKLEMFCHILHNMPLPHCSCQYVYFVCVPAFISWLYCWHVSQACIWPISCGGEVSCSFQAVFQSFTLYARIPW